MEGDLKVHPGDLIVVGYDFNVKDATFPLQVTFHVPQAVFTPRCGSNPSNTTFTVTMPDQSYTVTSGDWFPSGDQSGPLVYQGSKVVPDLCSGSQVRFDKGGTFSASVSSPSAGPTSEGRRVYLARPSRAGHLLPRSAPPPCGRNVTWTVHGTGP